MFSGEVVPLFFLNEAELFILSHEALPILIKINPFQKQSTLTSEDTSILLPEQD